MPQTRAQVQAEPQALIDEKKAHEAEKKAHKATQSKLSHALDKIVKVRELAMAPLCARSSAGGGGGGGGGGSVTYDKWQHHMMAAAPEDMEGVMEQAEKCELGTASCCLFEDRDGKLKHQQDRIDKQKARIEKLEAAVEMVTSQLAHCAGLVQRLDEKCRASGALLSALGEEPWVDNGGVDAGSVRFYNDMVRKGLFIENNAVPSPPGTIGPMEAAAAAKLGLFWKAAGGGAGSVEKEAAGGDGGAASRWSFHPFPASVAMTDAKAVAAHFQAKADAENASFAYKTAQGAEEIVFPTYWGHGTPDFLKNLKKYEKSGGAGK